MSYFRGQRFHIDLDSDSDDHADESEKTREKIKSTTRPRSQPSESNNTHAEAQATGKAAAPSKTSKSPAEASYSSPLPPSSSPSISMPFVADVVERKPPSRQATLSPPPPPPSLEKSGNGGAGAGAGASTTGFPAHKKRVRSSVFKGARQAQRSGDDAVNQGWQQSGQVYTKSSGSGKAREMNGLEAVTPSGETVQSVSAGNKNGRKRSDSIDRENRTRMATMSPAEIAREREELLQNLSPAFVKQLLQRVDIGAQSQETSTNSGASPGISDGDGDGDGDDQAEFPALRGKSAAPRRDRRDGGKPEGEKGEKMAGNAEDHKPTTSKDTQESTARKKTVSFAPPPSPPPSPPNPTDDPPSPRTLHRLYFPDQPPPSSNPALSWTLPVNSSSPSSLSSTSTAPTTLSISTLRFSLSGTLIPPSIATSLPVTLGLHHHAASPDAAGYTIPELARLARSAVPAQRCVAIKALGGLAVWIGEQLRIERAGRRVDGEGGGGIHDDDNKDNNDDNGNENESKNDADAGAGDDDDVNERMSLLRSLWSLVKRERVLDILRLAAGVIDTKNRRQDKEEGNIKAGGGGHLSVTIYAEDALAEWKLVEAKMGLRRAV